MRLISNPSPIEFFSEHAELPTQLLHIGAHLAEEKHKYEQLGIVDALWVEAQPEIFKKMADKVGARNSLNTAVWSTRTTLILKVSRNSVSSSLLDLDTDNPWGNLDFIDEFEVGTLTMDDVIIIFENRGFLHSDFFLVLDIQGAEREALSGWKKNRMKTVAISCEVSKYKGYRGASRRWQTVIQMLKLGFLPGAAFLDEVTGHGDQLFIRWTSAIANPKIILLSLTKAVLLNLIRIKNRLFRPTI